MKLTINLMDSTLCDGCPCWCDSMGEPGDQYDECTAGYWKKDTMKTATGVNFVGCLRPQKCIDDNGK